MFDWLIWKHMSVFSGCAIAGLQKKTFARTTDPLLHPRALAIVKVGASPIKETGVFKPQSR